MTKNEVFKVLLYLVFQNTQDKIMCTSTNSSDTKLRARKTEAYIYILPFQFFFTFYMCDDLSEKKLPFKISHCKINLALSYSCIYIYIYMHTRRKLKDRQFHVFEMTWRFNVYKVKESKPGCMYVCTHNSYNVSTFQYFEIYLYIHKLTWKAQRIKIWNRKN